MPQGSPARMAAAHRGRSRSANTTGSAIHCRTASRSSIVGSRALHALSDPVRLKIVESIADRDERNCSSVEASVSKSTLSHHFKVLREAGVTHTRANGTQRLISLRRDDLEDRFPGLLDSILAAARSVSRVGPRV